jgi:hypothetical protein
MTLSELDRFYRSVKEAVIVAGFSSELVWISGIDSSEYSEADLLREAAWVILSSGFSERVVRARFHYISLCYCDWESAAAIAERGTLCIHSAKHVFGNEAKLAAIVRVAEAVVEWGFQELKRRIDETPLEQLKKFPFIGDITAMHLAKNLGYPFAKNDRHLSRLARSLKFPDAQRLCEGIAAISGDTISVVDTVLWRFSASKLATPKHGSFGTDGVGQ